MKHTGSCLCGAVKFEVTGDFERFYLCHCKWCRKDTGSAHAANLFSSTAELRWLSGRDKVRTFQLPETDHQKGFCSVCGSALPNMQMDGALLVVPAGSLNSPLHLAPQGHIFISNKASWDHNLHEVRQYDRFPQEN